VRPSIKFTIAAVVLIAALAYVAYERHKKSILDQQLALESVYARRYIQVGALKAIRIADGSSMLGHGPLYAFTTTVRNTGDRYVSFVDLEYEGPHGWVFTSPEDKEERPDSLLGRIMLLGDAADLRGDKLNYLDPGESLTIGDTYYASQPDPEEIWKPDSTILRSEDFQFVRVGCDFAQKEK